MKRKSKDEKADELRPEYHLSQLLKHGVQGKYTERYRQGNNIVLLDSDVARAFPSKEAVNEALRLVIRLMKLPNVDKQSQPKVDPTD